MINVEAPNKTNKNQSNYNVLQISCLSVALFAIIFSHSEGCMTFNFEFSDFHPNL